MSMLTDLIALLAAFANRDVFAIRSALASDATWIVGVVVLLLAGAGLAWIYHKAPPIERYFERTIMVTSYLGIALIIFWGVIDRFVFSNQQPWSTTIPPLLFMIMAWFGAAYSVRVRTHLSFSEFRTKLPRNLQFLCLCLDCVLWFGFALILWVTTMRLVVLSASNFQIVLGTDNTMQWWFLTSAPIAAILIAARAIENMHEDVQNLRAGRPLIQQAVIGRNA